MTPRVHRTQWIQRDEPKAEPVVTSHQKALRLPRPGPGVVVRIPLHLLVEYLQLYQLEPTGIQEPKIARRDGPGEAILLVKRIRKEEL